jgi:hypothetical protein
VLRAADFDVREEPAPAILSLPPRLLDRVAGRALGALVPDRLAVLRADNLETLVYPSDVAISGPKDAVARARSAIAAQLTSAPAWLTTSREAQEIEDALSRLSRAGEATDVAVALRALDGRLARLSVPFDEWETLYRKRLQVERDLLSDGAEARRSRSSGTPPGNGAGLALGLAGLTIAAADVVLAVADGLDRRSGRRS